MLFWCLAVRWLRLYSTSTAEGDVLLLVREQDSQPKKKSNSFTCLFMTSVMSLLNCIVVFEHWNNISSYLCAIHNVPQMITQKQY